MNKFILFCFSLSFLYPLAIAAQVYEWYDLSSVANSGLARHIMSAYDSEGNIYDIGTFSGQMNYTLQDPDAFLDDDLGINGQQYSNSIIKRTPEGEVIWAGNIDHVFGNVEVVVIDGENNLILGGYYSGAADMDLSEDSFNLPWSTQSAFVAKYSPEGNLIFAKALARPISTAASSLTDIHVDGENNLYCSFGGNGEVDLDPSDALLPFQSSSQFAAITKLSALGDYQFSRVVLGDSGAYMNCYWLDQENETMLVYARGENIQFGDPDNLLSLDLPNEQIKHLLLSLSLDGEIIDSSFSLPQEASGIGVNRKANGDLVLIGEYDQDIVIEGETPIVFNAENESNIFIAFSSPDGLISQGTYIHSPENSPTDVCLDEGQTPYVYIAFTEEVSFFTPNGEVSLTSNGEEDAFVGRLNDEGLFDWGFNAGGTASDSRWHLSDYPGEDIMILSTAYRDEVNFGGIIGTLAGDNWPRGVIAKINFCELDNVPQSIDACDEFTIEGLTITESMSITAPEINLGACIANNSLDVNIWPSYSADSSISACEAISFQGEVLEQSGWYSFENSTIQGCDSITNILFDLLELQLEINLSEGVLEASSNAQAFQWGLCSGDFEAIDGATLPSFTPSEAGEYMLEVSSGDCSVFSDCISVSEEELNVDEFLLRFTIYPNPTSRLLNLSSLSPLVIIERISIFNALGEELLLPLLEGQLVDLAHFRNGIYYIKISTNRGTISRKIILQH